MQDDEDKAAGLVQVRLLRPKVLDKEEIQAVSALNPVQVKMELQQEEAGLAIRAR